MGRLCSARYERDARQHGWLRIAGLDEAGRGSLFGPVVAGAVVLNPRRRIVGLDDSKKLAPERRGELAERIREHALAWAVAEIDASRIDAWNIYQASRQAMVAAISQLHPLPDYLLLDAIELDLPIEQKALIHGDARSVSIAAASILAKVDRDKRMEEFDQLYPQYGLAQNKGYGTPDHLEALRLHGPTPLHRFSYAPVREARCWAAGAEQTPLAAGDSVHCFHELTEETTMIKVGVFYPKSEGSKFDMKYYLEKHTPMVREKMGAALKGVAIDQGLGGGMPGTPMTYAVICTLLFDSVESFYAAFAPHAAAITGDISNYTNVQPIVQVSEVKV